MTGWISLHRSIQKHWLFEEKRKFSRFEAWIDILLMVNHSDNKIMHDGDLITVKRGQLSADPMTSATLRAVPNFETRSRHESHEE